MFLEIVKTMYQLRYERIKFHGRGREKCKFSFYVSLLGLAQTLCPDTIALHMYYGPFEIHMYRCQTLECK